ncbi:hypothetical protein [Curtobacterium sp. MCSS17_016]|nr:hypothetical protein [Curtobacterium sp. MCSS17_016]WIE80192.1 hypothetical protein DEJ19_006380 [Curtobacterium sp. MCSS17_016]
MAPSLDCYRAKDDQSEDMGERQRVAAHEQRRASHRGARNNGLRLFCSFL